MSTQTFYLFNKARELMLNRQLSALQKKRIKEAMVELEKFSDCPKMRSGINIGHLAKRFSSMEGALLNKHILCCIPDETADLSNVKSCG